MSVCMRVRVCVCVCECVSVALVQPKSQAVSVSLDLNGGAFSKVCLCSRDGVLQRSGLRVICSPSPMLPAFPQAATLLLQACSMRKAFCRRLPKLQSFTLSPGKVHGKESENTCRLFCVCNSQGFCIQNLSHTQHLQIL